MIQKLNLISRIDKSCVVLGAGNRDKNEIQIAIRNDSGEPVKFSGFGNRGDVFLYISVGREAEDLVADREEANKITMEKIPDKWKQKKSYEEKSYVKNKLIIDFELPGEIFDPNEEKIITLKNFESNTDPGKVKIKVEVTISGYESYEQPLEVEKELPEFQLLYFDADPPYIITEEDKQTFVLRWNTIKAGKVILKKNNVELKSFIEGEDFNDGEKHEYTEEKPSILALYELVAEDKNQSSNKESKNLTVQVLEKGWHKMNFECYGYPSALCNMNDVKLFGIFIKVNKASLYSSEYPLSVWKPVYAEPPAEMYTSPAVCFDSKLWLVGGSTADPDKCSRKVYCYENGLWRAINNVPKEFTARMGHTCVVFKKKLWALGGLDDRGNALNEVWSLGTDGKWQKYNDASWEPRCMFAATVFKEKIWIYGGAKLPFGESLNDLWFSDDGENWSNYAPRPTEEKPIGCALQAIENKLNVLGSFEKNSTIVARRFVLDESYERWDSSEITGAAWLEESKSKFSIQSVEYKKVVFVTWLDYRLCDSSRKQDLNIYVI